MSKQIITRRCSKCKEIKPLSEFYKRTDRPVGYWPKCKKCKLALSKKYQQSKKGKQVHNIANRKYRRTKKGNEYTRRYAHEYRIRYPERIKAHTAVRHAIKIGKLPRPNTLQCYYCPEQAKQYHHPSYSPEHWLDVVPVCAPCHIF